MEKHKIFKININNNIDNNNIVIFVQKVIVRSVKI